MFSGNLVPVVATIGRTADKERDAGGGDWSKKYQGNV